MRTRPWTRYDVPHPAQKGSSIVVCLGPAIFWLADAAEAASANVSAR